MCFLVSRKCYQRKNRAVDWQAKWLGCGLGLIFWIFAQILHSVWRGRRLPNVQWIIQRNKAVFKTRVSMKPNFSPTTQYSKYCNSNKLAKKCVISPFSSRPQCNSGYGDHPLYVNVDMHSGNTYTYWIDALQASFPAVQVGVFYRKNPCNCTWTYRVQNIKIQRNIFLLWNGCVGINWRYWGSYLHTRMVLQRMETVWPFAGTL